MQYKFSIPMSAMASPDFSILSFYTQTKETLTPLQLFQKISEVGAEVVIIFTADRYFLKKELMELKIADKVKTLATTLGSKGVLKINFDALANELLKQNLPEIMQELSSFITESQQDKQSGGSSEASAADPDVSDFLAQLFTEADMEAAMDLTKDTSTPSSQFTFNIPLAAIGSSNFSIFDFYVATEAFPRLTREVFNGEMQKQGSRLLLKFFAEDKDNFSKEQLKEFNIFTKVKKLVEPLGGNVLLQITFNGTASKLLSEHFPNEVTEFKTFISGYSQGDKHRGRSAEASEGNADDVFNGLDFPQIFTENQTDLVYNLTQIINDKNQELHEKDRLIEKLKQEVLQLKTALQKIEDALPESVGKEEEGRGKRAKQAHHDFFEAATSGSSSKAPVASDSKNDDSAQSGLNG